MAKSPLPSLITLNSMLIEINQNLGVSVRIMRETITEPDLVFLPIKKNDPDLSFSINPQDVSNHFGMNNAATQLQVLTSIRNILSLVSRSYHIYLCKTCKFLTQCRSSHPLYTPWQWLPFSSYLVVSQTCMEVT